MRTTGRPGFSPTGILLLIAYISCCSTGSAQTAYAPPPGDVLATVYYTSLDVYPAPPGASAQAAAAISEKAIQSNDSYSYGEGSGVTVTDTFGTIQACPEGNYYDGAPSWDSATNSWINPTYNGNPQTWCAEDTTTYTLAPFTHVQFPDGTALNGPGTFPFRSLQPVAWFDNYGCPPTFTDAPRVVTLTTLPFYIATCPASWTASITANPRHPVIPAGSSVKSGMVLTRDWLTISVSKGGNPAPGINVVLQSDRPHSDNITQPTYPTDQAGQTAGMVDTRDNAGGAASTLTVANGNIQTETPANVTWLPARYEESFKVTCYAIPPESDFLQSPLVSAPGISGRKFHSRFLFFTAINGTGEALDGTYIHYHKSGWYTIESCPRTATGACATDGITIAVDPAVIPLHGKVSIDTLGDRTAQDTGGGIKGYHIDSYWGTRFDQCRKTWTNPGLGVAFLHYGTEN